MTPGSRRNGTRKTGRGPAATGRHAAGRNTQSAPSSWHPRADLTGPERAPYGGNEYLGRHEAPKHPLPSREAATPQWDDPQYRPTAPIRRWDDESPYRPTAAVPRWDDESAYRPTAAVPRWDDESAYRPTAAVPRWDDEPAYRPTAAIPQWDDEPPYRPTAAIRRWNDESAVPARSESAVPARSEGDGTGQAARKRVGKAIPAVAIAATLAAGAAAYVVVTTSSGATGDLTASMANAPAAGLTFPAATSSGASGAGSASSAGSASVGFPAAIAGPLPATQRGRAPVTKRAAANKAAAGTPAKTASPAATASSAPATSSAPAHSPTATALTCNTASGGLLPMNVTAIVSFLLDHGYSHNAAAGIAGNMYQESKGDPESVGSGGGGLIGFTPLPGGYVTGNPAVDLQNQLQAVLTYNQQWASYLPALESAASPADAAYIYVTDFERAGIPAASTREASAQDVASACGI